MLCLVDISVQFLFLFFIDVYSRFILRLLIIFYFFIRFQISPLCYHLLYFIMDSIFLPASLFKFLPFIFLSFFPFGRLSSIVFSLSNSISSISFFCQPPCFFLLFLMHLSLHSFLRGFYSILLSFCLISPHNFFFDNFISNS